MTTSGKFNPEKPFGEHSDHAVPRYRWIREQLLKRIVDGKLKRGDPFDSEVQIAKQLNVSLGTVRKAVDELVAQHVLDRRQGKGTFVATRDASSSLRLLFNLVDEHGTKELPAFRDVLGLKTRSATAREAGRLSLAPRSQVVALRRSRAFSNGAVMLEDVTLPAQLFPDFEQRLGQRRPVLLYEFYEQEFGVSIMNFEERLRAIKAGKSAAKVMGCPVDHALLEIERTSYGFDDSPVELRITLCETSRHHYLHPR